MKTVKIISNSYVFPVNYGKGRVKFHITCFNSLNEYERLLDGELEAFLGAFYPKNKLPDLSKSDYVSQSVLTNVTKVLTQNKGLCRILAQDVLAVNFKDTSEMHLEDTLNGFDNYLNVLYSSQNTVARTRIINAVKERLKDILGDDWHLKFERHFLESWTTSPNWYTDPHTVIKNALEFT